MSSVIAQADLATVVGLCVGGSRFVRVQLASGQGAEAKHLTCYISHHLGLQHVYSHLEVDEEGVRVVHGAEGFKVDVPMPLNVRLVQSQTVPKPEDSCIHVMANGQHYFTHRQQPDVFVQLYQVFTTIPGHKSVNVECYSLAGARCHAVCDVTSTVRAVTSVQYLMHETPFGPPTLLTHCLPVSREVALTVQKPYELAEDWWLSFPFHFAKAMGLEVALSHFPPPEATPMLLSIRASLASAAFDLTERF